jgi:hypothetical protein
MKGFFGGKQMVKWLMRRAIAAFERQWDYDASYLHEIIEASPRAAWMFSRAAAIGKYRKDVPAAAWAAAAITAVRARSLVCRWPSARAWIRRSCARC